MFFYRKILDISSLFSVILTEKDYGIDTNIQYGDLLTQLARVVVRTLDTSFHSQREF